jgi:cell wall-associated NlpC family hydrolase
MKLRTSALVLLTGIPSVLSAQVKVGASLGPITLMATVSGRGVTLRAAPGRARHARAAPLRRVTTSASASRVLTTGKRYLGTPYRYGGASPATGFDCSGFVYYIFGRNGVDLPRTSRLQAGSGRSVPRSVDSLVPGDLMLFSSRGRGVDHVAIYVGNNRMMHSTAGAGKVVYDDLSTARGKWYLARHVASRRVL